MRDDYYQNTLYPLQDKILEIVGKLPVGFYLTGGTALSRAYLHHRYSDDLDFFVNNVPDFKSQVNIIIKALADLGHTIDFFVFSARASSPARRMMIRPASPRIRRPARSLVMANSGRRCFCIR